MISPALAYQMFAPAQGIETALQTLFRSQGINAHRSFDKDIEDTPRVELQVILGAPAGRYLLNAIPNGNAQYQPFNSWQYNLVSTVVTERTQNGDEHAGLIGRTRYALQYFRLVTSLTTTIAPYHTLTSIEEVGQLDSVDDAGNLQMSAITFRGVLNIRDSAWG